MPQNSWLPKKCFRHPLRKQSKHLLLHQLSSGYTSGYIRHIRLQIQIAAGCSRMKLVDLQYGSNREISNAFPQRFHCTGSGSAVEAVEVQWKVLKNATIIHKNIIKYRFTPKKIKKPRFCLGFEYWQKGQKIDQQLGAHDSKLDLGSVNHCKKKCVGKFFKGCFMKTSPKVVIFWTGVPKPIFCVFWE